MLRSAGWGSTKRRQCLVTHGVCSRKASRERLEKPGGADDPGQEGAPNSVFSPEAMCLEHWLPGERGGHGVQKCLSNLGTITSEAPLLGKKKL